MNKTFMAILLFFIFNINALALEETYYSPYSEFSSWDDVYVKEDDTKIVELERRYRWYKQFTEIGDYYIEGDNDLNYPLIDRTDVVETSFSDWQQAKPTYEANRITNTRYPYEYQDMKEVRYIHFNNLRGSYGSLRISEIEVYAGSNKIAYNHYCEGCNSNFSSYINNGITIENMSNINNDGYLRLDLNNYYPLDSLTVKLYLFDVGTEVKRYSIKITRDLPFGSTSYAEVTLLSCFTYDYLSQITPAIYNSTKMNITNPEWGEVKRTFDYVEATQIRKVEAITEYQYKDFLYRYYNIKSEYAQDYASYAINDYTIKDITDYKDYYRYQKRDKIIIKNNLIITSKTTKLEDFIVDSTTDEISIESDLNINQNGTYKVKYILPFKTIEKEVIVNINDNLLDDLNNQISNLKKENTELISELIIRDNEINKLIENNKNNNVNKNLDYTEFNQLIEKLQRMTKILSSYDDKSKVAADIIDRQEKLIKALSNEHTILKGNYNTTLLKLDNQNIEKVGFQKFIKFFNSNFVVSGVIGVLLVIILILWITNKKRSN